MIANSISLRVILRFTDLKYVQALGGASDEALYVSHMIIIDVELSSAIPRVSSDDALPKPEILHIQNIFYFHPTPIPPK